MEVELGRILEVFKDGGDDRKLEIRPDRDGPDIEGHITAALDAAVDRGLVDEVGESLALGPWWYPRTPPSYVLLLPTAPYLEVLEEWVTAVADELSAAGVGGRIVPDSSDTAPYATINKVRGQQLAALMLFRVIDPHPTGRDRPHRWNVDPDTTRVAAQLSLRGATIDTDTVFASRLSTIMPPQTTADALAATLPRHSVCNVYHVRAEPIRVVDVRFFSNGSVIRTIFDPSLGWRERLDSHVQVLRAGAAHLDIGFVQHLAGQDGSWDVLHTGRPPLPGDLTSSVYRYHRHLMSRFVPDARGVSLLTPAHLDRAADLSSWRIEQLGDRYLVTAPDLAAWYAQPDVDPDVLAQARRDFGAMILTADDVAPQYRSDYPSPSRGLPRREP